MNAKMIDTTPKNFTLVPACEAVADLRSGDQEWTYNVVPAFGFPGFYWIAIFDETGQFVSYWTEE